MAIVNSTRELHTELTTVCSALEALFSLAGSDHEELEAAATPALYRFRELLDQGDSIVSPD